MPILGRAMDEIQLAKWREDYIRLEQDVRREIPEIKKKQEEMLGDIALLQEAERDEEARMNKIATIAAEAVMKQKGRKMEQWRPIIIQVIVTLGILGSAYIGYQGIIAQVVSALGHK